MTEYDVAFVGTGTNPDEPTKHGFAMAYSHADAYELLENCRLVACADIVRENAEAFAETYDVPDGAVFEDYERMLGRVEPDVVSICTPPSTHATLVTGCAESGVVDAIHCEKPMALTWGGATRMSEACDRNGVALTFNHMRRFGDPIREAKARLDDGAIGDVERIEYSWGNFYDNGTHAIDLCNYFNDEHAAEWVIAQIDYSEEDVRFGTHNENQVLASWEYDNGVYGTAATGPASDLADGDWRIVGTDGILEVNITSECNLRVRRFDGSDDEYRTYDGLASGDESCIDRAIADVVDALDSGRTSELCAPNALTATEIIFGGYESVRQRGRVDLPLGIEDNPLESMVAAGTLSPEPATDD